MSNSIIMSIVPQIWSFSLHDQQVLWGGGMGVFFSHEFIWCFIAYYFKQFFKNLLSWVGHLESLLTPPPTLGWAKRPSFSPSIQAIQHDGHLCHWQNTELNATDLAKNVLRDQRTDLSSKALYVWVRVAQNLECKNSTCWSLPLWQHILTSQVSHITSLSTV